MWHSTAPAADIAPGDYQRFDFDEAVILVFNLDGEFFALEDRCTHDDAELDGGAIENGCIKCPRHGACFDIRTGDAKSAPAYEATDRFDTRVNTDGIIEVDLS
ncbi:Rieske 2Fe-2S domain-containing protein [Litorivicinus lipolyticus]|uniref:Rieske 2Fe-2S domain-containing protein n=1 Tax=Litorivicinus lipolyticus TaxID=418701 RepID=A0A5Q2QFR3_9GAMM|nr:non-heme iron oxygenase ferredoxin subunit [Litorivicinus lipolyticus]QGG81192.1 Rieske 2Fe-2S domain-containing protein [Litorivicinus lipolyticus]